MVQWAWTSFINLFYFVNCALWSILTGFFPTLTSQAMLTIPVFDFQSNPKPLCPSWPSLKVRVQGSCVLCAHGPALFIPNQPALSLFFFFLCQNGEMHHKGHGHGFPFGLTQWKGQMGAPWNGSEAFTSPSQGPESLHHPEMAQTEPLWEPLSPEPGRSRESPWPCLVPLVALVSLQQCAERTNWCKDHHVSCATKLFI